MAILSAVSALVVRDSSGKINMESTLNNIQGAILAELEAKQETDIKVEAALHSVFDRLGVDIYPTPEVVSIAAATLVGSDLTKMSSAAEDVRDYLSRSSKFQGERGRKGGLRRVVK